MDKAQLYREIEVPAECGGMRVDRFLARRFADRSRSWLADGIRAGQVCDPAGAPLRPSARLREGQVLRLFLPGIAPSAAAPPMPDLLYADERVVVVDKPSGLLAHPAGSDFTWALISLAKLEFPDDRVDLVHRLDRDTSGCLLISRDVEANRLLKAAVKARQVHKVYEAITKGEIPWDHRHLRGPIGPDDGEIRIKMAIRPDGLEAHTEVQVVARRPGFTRIRCILHTGRTHQIRLHLAEAGFPLLGDRMYGVPPEVFLHTLDHGADAWVREAAGAPHHALHAAEVRFPHPDGEERTVRAPWPATLERWWREPHVLPHDGEETP